MTKNEMAALLKLISELYPNSAQVSDDTINAWQIAFSDITAAVACTAIRQALQQGLLNPDFPPSAPALLAIIKQLQDPRLDAEWLFRKGPGLAESEQKHNKPLRRAWIAWGGWPRWRVMPDEKYSDDAAQAIRVWEFEAKSFARLYAAECARTQQENFAAALPQASASSQIANGNGNKGIIIR